MKKPLKKGKYIRNTDRLRRTQGCLTDCVAYFLNLHPENVPYFVYPRKGWNDRLKRFFRKHGYKVWWAPYVQPNKGLHIVCGNSLKYKTYGHVVVYKGKKMVYDPDYPTKWSEKRATHILVVAPTRK